MLNIGDIFITMLIIVFSLSYRPSILIISVWNIKVHDYNSTCN